MVARKPHRLLHDDDLIDLYHGIEAVLPDDNSCVVQLVSCYPGEGVTTIGRELAQFALREMGFRSLLISVEMTDLLRSDTGSLPKNSLLEIALSDAQESNAVTASYNDILWNAFLVSGREREGLLPNLGKLKQVMTSLRRQFRLIVVATPGLLIDPTVVSMGCLTDAAVFVIEAERTRAPAAKQAIQTLKRAGIKVIGLAFNKRHYHIPNRLYRYL